MVNWEELKYEFIFEEIFQASARAALSTRNGRFPIYAKDVIVENSTLKSELKELVRSYVEEFILNSISEEKHYQKIEEITEIISNSANCKHHLYLGTFRIGITQKILNLTLKYLWCANVIDKEPPHCPIDRIIKNYLSVYRKNIELKNWTEIVTKSQYYSYINVISEIAKSENVSIAQWELKIYNKYRPL